MLNGIAPIISPDLLNALYRMGHGDEILFADAHFPGDSFGQRVIRADGLKIPDLIEAILPLFPLDTYADASLIMMSAVPGDELDPNVEASYRNAVDRAGFDKALSIERVERFAFYERAAKSYAVVMTGEMAKYGNLILKKGLAHI